MKTKKLLFNKNPAPFILLTLAVLVFVSQATEKSRKTNPVATTRIGLTLSKIPDSYLRDSSEHLLELLEAYTPPKEGNEPEDARKELELCIESRGVFAYYERYQVFYGEDASLAIRPVMRDMFKLATDKLSWIEERQSEVQYMQDALNSVVKRYDQLATDKLIEAPKVN